MTQRLKILTSAYACAPGGASERFGGGELILGWNVVQQLARFHEVWVLTHPRNRAAIEAGLSKDVGGRLHFVYFQLPGLLEQMTRFQGGIQLYSYFWQVRAYLVARRLHREVRFDAFHHVTYANDWMASYIGALLPVPYLRGPGGGAHRTPQAFLRDYSLPDQLWERFRIFGQWVLRHDPIFIRGQRRARALLVCNREAADAIPARWKDKIRLFPVNGISAEDLQIFQGCATSGGRNTESSDQVDAVPDLELQTPDSGPRTYCDPDSGRRTCFSVLSAGKLLSLKGYPLAIRAFAAFAQRHSGARLTIVGDGPERARLEEIVQDLAVENQIQLTKWMPRPDLLALMRQCDVFLFPSLRDGGGAVVVEAMAAGKPVICMDLAGPGLHVTRECGIKISARSPEEAVEDMAGALETLYSDRKLRVKMGQAARERAEKVYSWDHLGERLLTIYREVLGSGV